LLLTAVTTRKRSRIVWFAERNHAYFLLHPKHLRVLLRPASGRAIGTASRWAETLVVWLRDLLSRRDCVPRLGILDELLHETEFLELQRYLRGRRWDLRVVKNWNRSDLARAPAALASRNVAGFLLALSSRPDYDLSFRAVGCVEVVEHLDLPRDCKGQELVDYLVAD